MSTNEEQKKENLPQNKHPDHYKPSNYKYNNLNRWRIKHNRKRCFKFKIGYRNNEKFRKEITFITVNRYA